MLSRNSLGLIKNWAKEELDGVKSLSYQATQDELYQQQVEELLKELDEITKRKFNVFENSTEWFRVGIDEHDDIGEFIPTGDGHTNYYSIENILDETAIDHVCYTLEDVVDYLKKHDPIGFELGLYRHV